MKGNSADYKARISLKGQSLVREGEFNPLYSSCSCGGQRCAVVRSAASYPAVQVLATCLKMGFLRNAELVNSSAATNLTLMLEFTPLENYDICIPKSERDFVRFLIHIRFH